MGWSFFRHSADYLRRQNYELVRWRTAIKTYGSPEGNSGFFSTYSGTGCDENEKNFRHVPSGLLIYIISENVKCPSVREPTYWCLLLFCKRCKHDLWRRKREIVDFFQDSVVDRLTIWICLSDLLQQSVTSVPPEHDTLPSLWASRLNV